LSGIRKRFGSRVVFEDFSLTIRRGEVLFILGRSGQGKSVLLKMLVGLLPPDSGELILDGVAMENTSESEWKKWRRKCALIFQNAALLDSLDVRENIRLVLRAQGMSCDEEAWKNIVARSMGDVGLGTEILSALPSELSHGVQKRVSVARALALGCDTFLFDEPTTGQDPAGTRKMNELIVNLSKKGHTCVVVSHDMHCALAIADRIVLIQDGWVIAEETRRTIHENQHPELQAFLREAEKRSYAKAH
jgi:phospholipid/cholesterol/gamma-HCH transport system ATP-binding protein